MLGEPEASTSEHDFFINKHLRSADRSRHDANKLVPKARYVDAGRHPGGDKRDLGPVQGKLVASMSVLQLSKNDQVDSGKARSHVEYMIHSPS
jgi:hypothetical protein